jgi:hypothetical protein
MTREKNTKTITLYLNMQALILGGFKEKIKTKAITLFLIYECKRKLKNITNTKRKCFQFWSYNSPQQISTHIQIDNWANESSDLKKQNTDNDGTMHKY